MDGTCLRLRSTRLRSPRLGRRLCYSQFIRVLDSLWLFVTRERPSRIKSPSSRFSHVNLTDQRKGLGVLNPDDRVRFEQLVLTHLDAAFNLARCILRSRTDAEDVTQEAMLRAYRFFGSFHGGDARAWLLQIVRNTCYTWLEKSLMEEFNEELHRRPCATPESMAIAGNDREHLTHALETLSVALSASNRFSPHFMTRGVRSDLLDATSASAGARVGGIDG
ncbi:MAG: hypothetical protein DMG49_23945 [Acidobacteria bacterium]|nr:MAG: hypothetical protein DMG49_23945 [Acidobacteriota bacterium]